MDPITIEILIKKWNPHFDDVKRGEWIGTIYREKYLERIEDVMDLRHVVILTGVRRSGKSTIMRQLIGKMIEKGTNPQNLLYLYFEDLMVQRYIPLGADLIEKFYSFYLEKYNPQGKIYVFLDELQGVKEFNRWLHTHYEFDKRTKFIVSGSRRSLIEGKTATLLTGRNVQFDIYPFNFYEYLLVHGVEVKGDNDPTHIWDSNYSQQTSILHYLGNFLYEGGYPEIVLAKNEASKTTIANSYYRDILTRDVTDPNDIRASREIEILGLQVLADFTKTHTYRSLGKPQDLSVDTVKTYLEYFYRAYLFFENSFFSYKTKETQDIRKPKKLYIVDNGLRNLNTINLRQDLGQCAENTVFMELKKNNIAIHYWKGKQEVDFVVLDPRQTERLMLYNVSYTDEPHEREVKGLLEGLKEFKLDRGVVLTKNYFTKQEIERKTIKFIPLWVWLIVNGRVFFKEAHIQ